MSCCTFAFNPLAPHPSQYLINFMLANQSSACLPGNPVITVHQKQESLESSRKCNSGFHPLSKRVALYRWASTEHPRDRRLPSTFRRKVIKCNVGLVRNELQNNGIIAEHGRGKQWAFFKKLC